MRKKNNLLNKFINMFSMITAFLTSGHVLSISYGNFCLYLLILNLLIIILYLIINKQKIKIVFNLKIFFILLSLMLFVEIIFDKHSLNNLFYGMKLFVIIFYSFFLTETIDFKKFRKYYINILMCIALVSLFGYLIGIKNQFYYDLPLIKNFNGESYYNGTIFFAMNSFSRGRNIGIFWEPGIYAIFLSIALFFIVFDNEKLPKIKITIFILSLLSTYSTTGYFLLSIILFTIFFCRKNKSTNTLLLLFKMLLFLIILIIMFNGGFKEKLLIHFPRVFNKLFVESDSVNSRLTSIILNLKIFIERPFGCGVVNANNLYYNLTGGFASQTSTMTQYMAQYGIFGLLFVVMQLFSIINFNTWKKSQRLVLTVSWIIIMNVEITMYFSIIYILILYFTKNIKEDKLRNLNSGDKNET